MKSYLGFVSVFLLSLSAQAEELVRAVSFADALEHGVLRAGELTEEGALTVSAAPDIPFQLLLEFPDPGINSPVYALRGLIRYDNVEGDGFLQMDNHFGVKGTFFTKGLAPAGPLGKISGSSDWRPFVLPFYANSGDQYDGAVLLPEKLSLGLNLPMSGTVSISGVELYQYAAGEDPLQGSVQWPNDRIITLFGAIGGSLIGIWGAIVGVASSRGKARGFVFGSANVLLVIGIASLACGVLALATARPYGVYFPLLLIGIILVVVIGMLRGTLSSRYEEVELKRMQSMDA